MGVRILHDKHDSLAALYCSTSEAAFGPVFHEDTETGKDADERAEAFLRWLRVDPRTLDDHDLMAKYSLWLVQEPFQYARERLDALELDEARDLLIEREVAELADLRARFPQ